MHQYRQHRFYLIKGRLQTALLVLSYLQIPISKAFKIRFRNFALDSVTHPIPFMDTSITSEFWPIKFYDSLVMKSMKVYFTDHETISGSQIDGSGSFSVVSVSDSVDFLLRFGWGVFFFSRQSFWNTTNCYNHRLL